MGKYRSGKKTRAQQNAYKNFVMHSSFTPDDTDCSIKSEFLLGSNDLQTDANASTSKSQTAYKPAPFKIRAIKWLTQNGIIAVIISLSVSFVVWSATTIWGIHKDIAVLNERISNLVNEVD